jgi:CheY-like chemotaxis protein
MVVTPVQKIRVLTVDDRAETTKILSSFLRLSGFDPHAATSGAEALEIYATVRPHAVLLDLGMPGMDGFEVCRRIREMPDSEPVLIVVVSGYEEPEQRVKAILAGANYYRVKPVDPAQLITLIEQHATGLCEDDVHAENAAGSGS